MKAGVFQQPLAAACFDPADNAETSLKTDYRIL